MQPKQALPVTTIATAVMPILSVASTTMSLTTSNAIQGSAAKVSSTGTTPSTSSMTAPTVTKAPLKVSFRDRIKEMQGSKEPPKPNQIETEQSTSGVVTPSTTEKPKSMDHTKSEDSEKSRPWSKLKLATIRSAANSCDSTTTATEQPIRIAKIRPTTSSGAVGTSTASKQDVSTVKNRQRRNSERICSSDSEIKTIEVARMRAAIGTNAPHSFGLAKNYRSVDDLSPEFNCLPFVKKLKILNERQKLAELEFAIKSRSLSYESGDQSHEPLIRSQSEGSAITRTKTAATMTSNTMIVTIAPLNVPSTMQSPISPESNETLERRELKSILKKMSEDKHGVSSRSGGAEQDYKHLMHEPTVEGYVARHSKLMKSVTFDSTLSSPPNSAHKINDDAIDERTQFPFLSAQMTNEIICQQQQQQFQPNQISQSHQFTSSSHLIYADNSFLLDDSTNRLQECDLVNNVPDICDQSSPRQTTNPFISKKFIKGDYLTLPIAHFVVPFSFFFFQFIVLLYSCTLCKNNQETK